MTKEQLAAKLNGREIGSEVTDAEAMEAKESGLLVIFGASDDLCELRGAIYDEVGCYGGDQVLIDRDGNLLEELDRDDREILEKYKVLRTVMDRRANAIVINALWDTEKPYSWAFETAQPHAAFDVMEGDDKYCRGIVLDLKELE